MPLWTKRPPKGDPYSTTPISCLRCPALNLWRLSWAPHLRCILGETVHIPPPVKLEQAKAQSRMFYLLLRLVSRMRSRQVPDLHFPCISRADIGFGKWQAFAVSLPIDHNSYHF